MRVFLVRHGQTEWNHQKRVQGHTDVHLDSVGREQAKCVALSMANEGVERILASDLTRARDTAEVIALQLGLPIELDSRLRERSYGDWEGFKYDEFTGLMSELRNGQPDDHHTVAPPGGESISDLQARLKGVTDSLFEVNRTTLVVSHGGACSILLGQLLNIPLQSDRRFRFDNASISEVSFYRDGNRSLIRHNDTSHLAKIDTYSTISG